MDGLKLEMLKIFHPQRYIYHKMLNMLEDVYLANEVNNKEPLEKLEELINNPPDFVKESDDENFIPLSLKILEVAKDYVNNAFDEDGKLIDDDSKGREWITKFFPELFLILQTMSSRQIARVAEEDLMDKMLGVLDSHPPKSELEKHRRDVIVKLTKVANNWCKENREVLNDE